MAERVTCRYCEGRRTQPCHNCGGRGRVFNDDPDEYDPASDERECSMCDGSGRVECSQCGGSGDLPPFS